MLLKETAKKKGPGENGVWGRTMEQKQPGGRRRGLAVQKKAGKSVLTVAGDKKNDLRPAMQKGK